MAYGPTENNPPAGPWARVALRLPWPVSKQDDKILSPLLCLLYQQPFKREIKLREGIDWSAETFYMRIGESRNHVEAIYIFMIGDICDIRCDHCLRGRGPFPLCVVNRQHGAPKDCANCWWASTNRNQRCSFAIRGTVAYQQQVLPNRGISNMSPAMREDFCQLLNHYGKHGIYSPHVLDLSYSIFSLFVQCLATVALSTYLG
ncbi:Protein of unknown function DUF3716 [Penicillium samsonianum]|uniref:Protein of unknown function DUF3716 n=1 Tax=Penicillium samsonianum TaxID=1882272 RepID=UPI002548096A|nr:Protein of unknown function DUF3716 [Penicillium samsonianum]KAJ6150437.1 Protein of unknown function DUF3716 [Penicillium samsonianum]